MISSRSASWLGIGAFVLALLTWGGAALAQPLAGAYTIDSSLPSSPTNFTDFGTAFDALETNGVSAAVQFDVYDGTGPYVSNANYELGHDGVTVDLVAGVSAANTITFQAATGQTPRIVGSGATAAIGLGISVTISLWVPYVHLDGLDISGGTDDCIVILGDSSLPMTGVEIRNCVIHDSVAGQGLFAVGFGGYYVIDLVVENCFFYGNPGNGLWSTLITGLGGSVVIGNDTNTIFRHNTILANNAAPGASAYYHQAGNFGAPGAILAEFTDNILVASVAGEYCLGYLAGFPNDPVVADRNLYYYPGGAGFHEDTTTYPDFATWQGAGFDVAGLGGTTAAFDPLFVSATAGSEDLHLQTGSPAIDAAVASTATVDIDGDARPFGAANDIGADEYILGPEMDVQRPAGTSIPDGGNDSLGNLAIGSPIPLTYTIENTGTVDLNLAGTPLVSATANTNCVVNVTTQPTTPVAQGGGTTTFVVTVTVSGAGAFDFDVSIDNDDANENPYNFNAAGTGAIVPEIDVQRPAGTSIPSGGTDSVGTQTVGQASPITYTIENQGTGGLTLTGTPPDYVTLSALVNCTASVSTQPTTPIAAGNTTTFVVQVTPTAAGAFSVIVTILNDDADEGTYTFTISGGGVTGGTGGGGCCGTTDHAGSRGNLALAFAIALVLLTVYVMRRRVHG